MSVHFTKRSTPCKHKDCAGKGMADAVMDTRTYHFLNTGDPYLAGECQVCHKFSIIVLPKGVKHG